MDLSLWGVIFLTFVTLDRTLQNNKQQNLLNISTNNCFFILKKKLSSKSLTCKNNNFISVSLDLLSRVFRSSILQTWGQRCKATARKQQWCRTAMGNTKFSCTTFMHKRVALKDQLLSLGHSGIMRNPVGWFSPFRNQTTATSRRVHSPHQAPPSANCFRRSSAAMVLLLCGGSVQCFWNF